MNKDALFSLTLVIIMLVPSLALVYTNSVYIPRELYTLIAHVSTTLIAFPLIAAPIIGELLRNYYNDISQKKLTKLKVEELFVMSIYKKGWSLYILRISLIHIVLPAFMLLIFSIFIQIINIENSMLVDTITLWLLFVFITEFIIFIILLYRFLKLIELKN